MPCASKMGLGHCTARSAIVTSTVVTVCPDMHQVAKLSHGKVAKTWPSYPHFLGQTWSNSDFPNCSRSNNCNCRPFLRLRFSTADMRSLCCPLLNPRPKVNEWFTPRKFLESKPMSSWRMLPLKKLQHKRKCRHNVAVTLVKEHMT